MLLQVLCFPCEQWLANSRIALGNEVLLYGWDYDPSELEYRVVYKVCGKPSQVPPLTPVPSRFDEIILAAFV